MLETLRSVLRLRQNDYKIRIAQLEPHYNTSIEEVRYGFANKMNSFNTPKDAFFEPFNALGCQDTMRDIVSEVIKADFDLIFTNGANFTRLVQRATQQMRQPTPVVFSNVTDPADHKLINDLKTPGNNMTGVLTFESRYEERLENLRSIFPEMESALFIYDGDQECGKMTDYFLLCAKYLSDRGIALSTIELKANDTSLTGALNSRLSYQKPTVLFVLFDHTVMGHLREIIEIAGQHGVPVFTSDAESVHFGAAFSCGNDSFEIGEELALQACKILYSNQNPGAIPISMYHKKYCMRYNPQQINQRGIRIPREGWNWLTQNAEVVL